MHSQVVMLAHAGVAISMQVMQKEARLLKVKSHATSNLLFLTQALIHRIKQPLIFAVNHINYHLFLSHLRNLACHPCVPSTPARISR